MLNIEDKSALAQVRSYFDELGYGYISQRLVDEGVPLLFPDFNLLQGLTPRLNPIYGLLFALFRQGHAADEAVLREALPSQTFEAMITTGLLVQNARKQWKTPGLIVMPVEGLYLAISTPPQYPTATTPKQPVYLGIDSLWLITSYPPNLSGRRVLDICAGSGVQGLVCAARGASHVVALEKSETAIEFARFNAALNGLSDVVETRQSDLYSALKEGETFDYVVSNPPFMPVMEDVAYPIAGAGGADGTLLLREIFSGLPAYLADEAEGVLFCVALGDQYSVNLNREILPPLAAEHGLHIRAWVNDKVPMASYIKDGLDINIRHTCPEISTAEREKKIAEWLEDLRRRGVASSHTYAQIISFQKGRGGAGVINLPVYNPYMTDPLVAKTSLPGARN